MRLLAYLCESEKTFMDIINNEVEKSFRDFVRIRRAFIYRGVPSMYRTPENTEELAFDVKTPRSDRRPMNMGAVASKGLDQLFQQKFGWKPRSEGVFTSSVEEGARGYGKVCLFFPIGPYKYLFTKNMVDSYIDFPHLSSIEISNFCHKTEREYPKALCDEIDDWMSGPLPDLGAGQTRQSQIAAKQEMLRIKLLKFFVDGYQDNKLVEAMTKRTEIVWKCNSYLVVPIGAEEQILTELRTNK